MPPLPRLRVPALAELARQLRFTPPKAARRQLEAAEALAADLDPATTYPEDWIVVRITGFRPDLKDPAMVSGEALLSDLSPLIEHLCIAAKLRDGDLGDPAGWLAAAEVCRRWRVSRKTLDRYRRQGLLARRVAVVNGTARHRLVFSVSAVEGFERLSGVRLAGAAAFTRVDPDTEERIVRRAARYRERLGWSMGQAAARLAERFGRSPETVRQLLLRNDAGSKTPIFGSRAGRGARVREIIERAYDRGCGSDAAELAERFGVSDATVYRILAARRAQRLRELLRTMPAGAIPAALERPGAEEEVLGAAAARSGLGEPGPRTLAALHDFVLTAQPEGPKTELARATAFFWLRLDARRRIERLPKRDAPVAELDEIETRLRWAARLKAEMVRSQLPLAVKTVESFLEGRALVSLPTKAAAEVVGLAIDAVIEGAERFDPFKGGRLAAPVALALNRVASAWARGEGAVWVRPSPASRAAPRADPEGTTLEDFTRRVSAWQAWLDPHARIRAGLSRLPGELAELLAQRHAWGLTEAGAGPPRTLAALAAERGVIPARISRLEHRAMRLALELPERARRGVAGAGGGAERG